MKWTTEGWRRLSIFLSALAAIAFGILLVITGIEVDKDGSKIASILAISLIAAAMCFLVVLGVMRGLVWAVDWVRRGFDENRE